MRIPERLSRGVCFSFEFFPPKTTVGEEQLWATLRELGSLEPGFVSVTYGAGGSSRDRTIEIATHIKNGAGIEPLAHLAVRGHSCGEIESILARLRAAGVENLLCLRGDPPRGAQEEVGSEDFRYASDLVAFVRARSQSFALGGACYPEGHPESATLEADLVAVQAKVRVGVEFLITQLFFDNTYYIDFVRRARQLGIMIPIIPGIMPITDAAQVERFTKLCGATIPADLQHELAACREDAEAVLRLGVTYATQQCRDLIARGAPGVHFYTLNRSRATRQILEALRKEGY